MSEVAISKTQKRLVRGDQWNFGPFTHQDPDGTPIDLTGCTIFASVKWSDDNVDMVTEVGASANETGFYWIDQAAGKFAFRIKGRSARDATDSDNENVPKGHNSTFIYRLFNSLDALQTEYIKPLEIIIA